MPRYRTKLAYELVTERDVYADDPAQAEEIVIRELMGSIYQAIMAAGVYEACKAGAILTSPPEYLRRRIVKALEVKRGKSARKRIVAAHATGK